MRFRVWSLILYSELIETNLFIVKEYRFSACNSSQPMTYRSACLNCVFCQSFPPSNWAVLLVYLPLLTGEIIYIDISVSTSLLVFRAQESLRISEDTNGLINIWCGYLSSDTATPTTDTYVVRQVSKADIVLHEYHFCHCTNVLLSHKVGFQIYD